MFKCFLFIAFVTASSSISLRGVDDAGLVGQDLHWDAFYTFREKFDRKYGSIQDLENRFSIFRENHVHMLRHNADTNQTFTLGINQFSDLTQEEFSSSITREFVRPDAFGCKVYDSGSSSGSTEKNVDWRTQGVVSSVKNQGQCGSCWAFSSTGAMESAWAIHTGELLDLSEQELADCAVGREYASYGCNGGQMEGGFEYVINNGQCAENAYPYVSGKTGTTGKCTQTCTSVVSMSHCFTVPPNEELTLQSAVAMQPVSVAIEADTRYFQSYSGGILTDVACGTNLDHGVLVVGYGVDEKQQIPYWIVKNSWDTTWGDNGYVYIARTEQNGNPGICGIAMYPSFPVA